MLSPVSGEVKAVAMDAEGMIVKGCEMVKFQADYKAVFGE